MAKGINQQMKYSTFIQPSDLLAQINNPRWAIFDCRFDLQDASAGELSYLEAHIPGAQYAHLEDDLSGPITGLTGRHPLPSIEEMAALFGQWGIDAETQVVAYDSRGGGIAARLWWALKYLGHDAVAILEGGFPAWEREGYPIQSGKEQRSAAQFVPRLRPEMRIDIEELENHLDDFSQGMIDSRSAERYRGEEEPLDPVAGHIPGSLNRFWGSNLDEDHRLLAADTLREKFLTLIGDKQPSDLVVYCGSGVTGCFNLVIMEHLGMPGARLYPGSWSEWCADEDRPIKVGPEI
jgi:thiosulfate/3-mercaptopyruvate sulfurtransferase